MYHHVPEVNCPISKYAGAGWYAGHSGGLVDDDPNFFSLAYFGYLGLGGVSGDPDFGLDEPVLTPEQAWNIDSKTDDGKPAKGMVVAGPWADCSDADNRNDFESDYDLINTNPACIPVFNNVF